MTELLDRATFSVEVGNSLMGAPALAIFAIDGPQLDLRAQYRVEVEPGQGAWPTRLHGMRQGRRLCERLWAVLLRGQHDGLRPLPAPRWGMHLGTSHLTYEAVDVWFRVCVRLCELERRAGESEQAYVERQNNYASECVWAAQAVVYAYEDFTGRELDLVGAGAEE